MRQFRHWLAVWMFVLLAAGVARGQAAACTGLCLQQVACPAGSTTTISGTVYAPNGVDPIPNVTVYVPNAPVGTLPVGVACPVPGQLPLGSPLVGTFSAADGTYTLQNAPVGTNIPLVIVAGKWRRQVVVPGTTACANTQMDVRFARNQSEGDIPRFAVSTGNADQVECVLRKVGVDDAEFTDPAGGGRINLYQSTLAPGATIDAATPSANDLMGNSATLNSYDLLMLPCEGGAHVEPAAQLSNLVNYTNVGGRVYASHFAYEWLWHNPPFDSVAVWSGNNPAAEQDAGTATVNQGFTSGATLAQWLQLVKASTSLGQIDLSTIRMDVSGIVAPTQAWLNLNAPGNPVMQFTFDTPVGVTAGQCGRVLFNEYHVENGTNARGKTFPAECSNAAMTPQEKLLEYSLFDLSNDGGPATLNPTTADFGNEVVGFQTAAKTFTVKNNSIFSSVLTTAAATDDFAVTGNTCGTGIGAGASCAVSVVFKPQTLGAHTGSLTVVFGGTTLTAALTGTGIPALSIQESSLDFGSADVGTTVPRTLTITNSAPGPVALPAFAVTGDYLATQSCPNPLGAGAVCTVNLGFTPTVYGPRPGTFTATGTSGVLQTALTGNGLDFGVAINPGSGSVIAGLSTTPTAVATPLGGFSAPVTFTCTTEAPAATCALKTATMTLAAVSSFTLTITTTSEYTLVGYGVHSARGLAWISAGAGLLLMLARRRLSRRGFASLLAALVMTVVGAGASGCSGKLPSKNPTYTPPGTYAVQLSATDGTLTRTASYSMTVSAK